MDIPIDAEVFCKDVPCGRSTMTIINPISRRVTHVVVREKEFPHSERLVSLELVTESTPHQLCLNCTYREFLESESFVESEFVPAENLPYTDSRNDVRLWPYVLPDQMVPVEYERIPPGELAVRRGTRVHARDGVIGRVDEFLVDPSDGHITHLVLREGHLWGQREVTIPITQIERIDEDGVLLKLDKHSVTALPSVPVAR